MEMVRVGQQSGAAASNEFTLSQYQVYLFSAMKKGTLEFEEDRWLAVSVHAERRCSHVLFFVLFFKLLFLMYFVI